MSIVETFAKAVNAGGINKSLKVLGIDEKKIEQSIEKKKFVIENKECSIVVDFKPKINYLIIYLCDKKSSKKLLKTLKPDALDFKSFVVYIGYLRLFGKTFEVRLGAYGYTSSELGNALIGRTITKITAPKVKKKKAKKR
jgi:hypothetical protein